MIEFSKWLETNNLNTIRNQVSSDRGELGSAGFEGFQDIVAALKLVARQNPTAAKSMVAGLAGKLSVLIGEVDPDLAKRLRSGGSRFVSASANLAGG